MKAIGRTGRCTMQLVQSADNLVRYLFSLRKEDRSIAEIVTDRKDQGTKILVFRKFRNRFN